MSACLFPADLPYKYIEEFIKLGKNYETVGNQVLVSSNFNKQFSDAVDEPRTATKEDIAFAKIISNNTGADVWVIEYLKSSTVFTRMDLAVKCGAANITGFHELADPSSSKSFACGLSKTSACGVALSLDSSDASSARGTAPSPDSSVLSKHNPEA
jgi:hypothetical protein